ncbi:MAG: Ni/Fe hydrogenase subunit alpha [Nocardioides sp.]
MGETLVIDPVTRIEGHGKVTIHLDDEHRVAQARLHVVEFRGYERFVQGHPYWEAPVLLQRVCGICFVSHHLAGAKVLDEVVGARGAITPTAEKMRRLGHYAQLLQSHAAAYFFLTAPEMLFGVDAAPAQRNVIGMVEHDPELMRRVVALRKWGQELIRAVFGKRMHGILAVPGGVNKALTVEERDRFVNGGDGLISLADVLEYAQEGLRMWHAYHERRRAEVDDFARVPMLNMGLVDLDGNADLYDGRLRVVGPDRETVVEFDGRDYLDHYVEAVEEWSYMKFPFLRDLGREAGSVRVGPLARMNVTRTLSTKLAAEELDRFHDYTGGEANPMTLHTLWARAVEMLHAAEVVAGLLEDPDLLRADALVVEPGREAWTGEGVGVVEAPRGVLIHHYRADEEGAVTFANLVVATTHNNEAINRTIRAVADEQLAGQAEITEGMMNAVELGIRAYDPCLSCATHALGQMPLQVQLYDAAGGLLSERVR